MGTHYIYIPVPGWSGLHNETISEKGMELNIDTWLDPICTTQDQNLCSASSVTEGQQNDTHGSMPLNTSVSGNWSSFWKQMLDGLHTAEPVVGLQGQL